jgi:predicted N-formylglutamate amidohydrolase
LTSNDENEPADSMNTLSENVTEIINPEGSGCVVLLCEHASSHIPAKYNDLGIAPEHRFSHAVWDPGALEVARHLSVALDAALIASKVSRLVYDCNRPPEAAGAMPEKSELVDVPGNKDLSPASRNERVEEVYNPLVQAVSDVLAARDNNAVLITIHSFTPVYYGKQRAVEIGVLHDTDTRMADAMLAQAQNLPHRKVERNAPYGPEDGVTHSLKLHGLRHGIANVMLEVRNDLLRSSADEALMAKELLALIAPALKALKPNHKDT